MDTRCLEVRRLGRVGYADGLELQKELEADVIARRERDYLLLLEHPHTFTLGRRSRQEGVLATAEMLQSLGVDVFEINRGGRVTYHGPGQIVGYPVLDLEMFFTDLGRYMRHLEEVIIRTIAHYGIEGNRLQGATGVWLDADNASKARKICAMGVRCSRWVTIHGFALNVNTDLRYFDYIIPCGITDKTVTSMEKELRHKVDMHEIKALLKQEFAAVFETEIVSFEEQALVE